jgi:saccharopine dehydrogenase-like NADP-dependent oxidoreductase
MGVGEANSVLRKAIQSMNVALFGGAGSMGTSLARKLNSLDCIDEIIVADKRVRSAKHLAHKLGDKVSAEHADANNEESIGTITKKADLVVALVPRTSDTLNIMRTCIDDGAHYMDLGPGTYCIFEMLKHTDSFSDSGLLALPCWGADPGISNVLAKHLSTKLDTVNEIKIRDGACVKKKGAEFSFTYSPTVFLRESSTKSVVYENGAFRRAQPLSREEDFEFPSPVGKQKVYLVEHEEPLTIPRFLGKKVGYVDFKLAVSRDTYDAVRALRKLGLLSEEPVEVNGTKVMPLSVTLAMLPLPVVSGELDGYECLAVQATGVSAGKKTTVTASVYLTHKEAMSAHKETATAFLTTTPPAVVVEMLAKDEIPGRGVILPEMMDALPIVGRLKSAGIPITVSQA